MEGDKKFWWGLNSWGRSWGINGHFKIERGVNMVGIEKGAYFAHASPAAHGGCADVSAMQHDCAEKVVEHDADGAAICKIRNKCTGSGAGDRGEVRKVTVKGVGAGPGKCGAFTMWQKIHPGETATFPGLLYCCPIADELVEKLGKECLDEDTYKNIGPPTKPAGKCIIKNTCDTSKKRTCGSRWITVAAGQVLLAPEEFCTYSNKCAVKVREE